MSIAASHNPFAHILRHLASAVVSALGASMVFTFVVLMNMYSEPPSRELQPSVTGFEIDEKPPKKKRKQRSYGQPRAKKVRTSNDRRAPIPNIASNISGVDFNIPGVVAADDLGEHRLESIVGSTPRTMVMTQDAVDEPAAARRRVAPAYPVMARRQGITGHVTLNLLIDEAGYIERTKVLDASPAGVFEEAALDAIRRWEFDPATYGGSAVSSWVKQTIRFQLR
jgi:protein TonB